MWKKLILKAELEDAQFGTSPRGPATEDEIGRTVDSAKKILGNDLPKKFLELLRFRNGFGYEGLLIYSGDLPTPEVEKGGHYYRDFVDADVVWRDFEDHKKYLFFGEADLYLYGLNLVSGQYEQLDRSSCDVLETYPDFFHMIEGAMRIYYPVEKK